MNLDSTTTDRELPKADTTTKYEISANIAAAPPLALIASSHHPLVATASQISVTEAAGGVAMEWAAVGGKGAIRAVLLEVVVAVIEELVSRLRVKAAGGVAMEWAAVGEKGAIREVLLEAVVTVLEELVSRLRVKAAVTSKSPSTPSPNYRCSPF
jgi:hypothetical protein